VPATILGVIGPNDLVRVTARAVDASPGLVARPLAYTHESKAPDVVRAHADEVDAWLFTGPVPQRLADRAQVLELPSESVSYSGVTLLAALMRLQRSGQDVDSLSIDTLDSREVNESLAAAGMSRVRVRLMRGALPDSAQIVEFHRQARREHGCKIAITCLGSAYAELKAELPAFRLTPSPRDIREAISSLTLKCAQRRHADAQVVIGLLDTSVSAPVEQGAFDDLGATVGHLDDGLYLLVTTRGPLLKASSGFAQAPIPEPLLSARGHTWLGIGVGRSAGEAHALARRALARAKLNGRQVAVICLPTDHDIILQPDTARPRPATAATDLSDLASRVGVRRSTLQQLRTLAAEAGDAGMTSATVAAAFGIQERSARRLLTRLRRAAVATPVREVAGGGAGRPAVVYRILF
jgi:hypothetical protein